MWVEITFTAGDPYIIKGFKPDNNTSLYQLYLPGNVNVADCKLFWDGDTKVEYNGTTYENGDCPIPPANTNTEEDYIFTDGTEIRVITYQGSSSVPPVFIDINGGKESIDAMDGDPNHDITCTGTINIDGTWYVLEKMKGRGNATWKESRDKRPYNITLGTKINFPGIDSEKTKKWSLLAEILDRSLLGNRAGFHLAYEMGIGQDTNSADVWMNGEYQGCYTVTPKTDSFVTKDGFMVEQDNYIESKTVAEGGDPQFTLEGLNTHVSGWDSSYNFITVKKIGDNILGKNASGEVDESPDNMIAKAGIIHDWLQEAWDAIRSEDGWHNGHYYTEYIDIESFAKMYLMQEYIKSYDVCAGSILFYRDGMTDGDKLYAGPLWDLDNAMGSTYQNSALGYADNRKSNGGDRRSAEGSFIQNISYNGDRNDEYKTSIYKKLFKHDDFVREVYYQYNQYRAEFDRLAADLQEMANSINDSAIMNHVKVIDIGNRTGKNNHYYGDQKTFGSGQYAQTYKITNNWSDYVDNLKTYITVRSKWFQNNYTVQEKTVTFNANGGTGTMKTQSVFPNRETVLNANNYFRAGYSFAGWNTQADGSGEAFTDKQAVTLNNDITLYAQWTLLETAQIFQRSLLAEGYLGVRFYLNIPSDESANAVVRLSFSGDTGTEPVIKENDAIDLLTDRGYIAVYYVTSKEMHDNITVQLLDKEENLLPLLDKEGNDVTLGYQFSVMDYIEIAQGTDNKKLKNLVDTMQVYGDWAQVYFNYKADGIEPDTSGFKKITKDTVSQYAQVAEGTMPDGLTYNNSSLMLGSDLGIRHYFNVDEGKDISNYTFTLQNGTVLTPTLSKDRKYFVVIPNIAAKDLGVTYTVTVSDGSNSWHIDYSAMSYVYRVLSVDSASDNLKQLCKALYKYYQAAVEYF